MFWHVNSTQALLPLQSQTREQDAPTTVCLQNWDAPVLLRVIWRT
jgi:hypothetical protein